MKKLEIQTIVEIQTNLLKEIINQKEANSYNEEKSLWLYWKELINIYENCIFDEIHGNEDEYKQASYASFTTNEGKECYIEFSVRYISMMYRNRKDKFCTATIEEKGDKKYIYGKEVKTSVNPDAPRCTIKKSANYPIFVTLSPLGNHYIVLDGNHRIENGEREVCIVPEIVAIFSITTLYGIFVYLYLKNGILINRHLTVKNIIEYNEKIVNVLKKERLTNYVK